jgi:hypothetical protein
LPRADHRLNRIYKKNLLGCVLDGVAHHARIFGGTTFLSHFSWIMQRASIDQEEAAAAAAPTTNAATGDDADRKSSENQAYQLLDQNHGLWRTPHLRDCDFMADEPLIAYIGSGPLSRVDLPRSWLPPPKGRDREIAPKTESKSSVLAAALRAAPVRLDMKEALEIKSEVALCKRIKKPRVRSIKPPVPNFGAAATAAAAAAAAPPPLSLLTPKWTPNMAPSGLTPHLSDISASLSGHFFDTTAAEAAATPQQLLPMSSAAVAAVAGTITSNLLTPMMTQLPMSSNGGFPQTPSLFPQTPSTEQHLFPSALLSPLLS